jgi:S-DNA-T family DNA segregation ATPase FtsK/SpoIIIE
MDNVHKLYPDHNNDDDGRELDGGIVFKPAERVDLPADESGEIADADVIEGEVAEGEILTEEEVAELDRRSANRGVVAVRKAVAGTQVATRVVYRVGTHDKTKTAGKVVLREGFTVVQGVESWLKRAWDASTQGTYRRMIKAAELAGDREELKEWTDRKEAATERRHRRLMDLPKLAFGVLKVTVSMVIGIPFLVLVVAILAKATGNASFSGVWLGFFGLIGFLIAAGAVIWSGLSIAAPFLIIYGAWREGRKRAMPPAWLITTADAEWDVAIDETTIAKALDALRIPAITQYLKSGLKLQFITPARVDGRGTHAVVRLPAGVTAEKIARRRGDLATGLHRAAKEVWPKTGSEAGILDIWIADKGALAEGAGDYPLLSAGLVDVFKGVPVGKTLRGDEIVAPIMERNTMAGGMPGQGKSTGARDIMAGCALDPTAELRIWVPDTNFDFEAFKPRCASYVMGADDDSLKEIRDQLVNIHEEVQRRGQLLVDFETPAVTRELASAGVGLHPLVCLLEEAHVAITHEIYGKEISKVLIDIVKLGRKRGIHMIISTQAPTKDSMPRDITRNCSNGIAFAVGDHVANDALLGQGAYAAGHRATELIPGTDRGTAVVKGFSGERSEIVQFYYLDVAKGNDQVTPLIKRSLDAIAKLGKTIQAPEIAAPETRDLLTDLDAVLGDEPVNVADVPALLKRHAPNWLPYQGLTGKALRELLAADHGIKVPSTGNRYPVDPTTVREAIVRREQTADTTDEDAGNDGEAAS